jgi:hypothetical protein
VSSKGGELGFFIPPVTTPHFTGGGEVSAALIAGVCAFVGGGQSVMAGETHALLTGGTQAAVHPERNKIYSCLGGGQAPEIEFSRKTPLEDGDIILVCSDGLWGVTSGESMAVTLKGANLLQAAPMVMAQAEVKGGTQGDNLSMVAVRWEESYVEPSESSVSTQAMTMDQVTTRLDEFGRNPSAKTDLSEDEIEQAIEEIRLAIDKYTPKK